MKNDPKSYDVYMISASDTIDHELNKNTERAYNKVIAKGRKPLINTWTMEDKKFVEICYTVSTSDDEQIKDLLDANKQEYCMAITKEGELRLIACEKADEKVVFKNTFAPHIKKDELPLGAIIRLLYSIGLEYDKLPPEVQDAVKQEMSRRESEQKQSDDVLENLTKWYKKGQYYIKQGQSEKALEYFDKVLEIDPTDSVVWSDKGEVLVELQRFGEASNCYTMTIRTGGNNSWFLEGKGIAHLGLKEYARAAECFINTLQLDAENAGTWNNLGIAFEGLNRYDDSIKCFNRALQINPHSNVLINKARILEKIGRLEDAARCYEEARKLK